jgi:DNA repair protein RAD50
MKLYRLLTVWNLFLIGKVSGETETKGQIKLRFKTAAGRDVVCIRSFQLTQKASKMEYKAIESVLQTINPHSGEV